MDEFISCLNMVRQPKRNPARLHYSSGGFSLWVCFMLFVLFVISYPLQTRAQIISTFAGTGLAGYYGDGAAATLAMLDSPTCLATDGAGNIYINDQRNSCVRRINSAGNISTIAGTGVAGYGGDNGPATSAQLNVNWGIAIDDTGNIYIADQLNYRVRKVNTAGIITTFAGTGTSGYSGNGGPATAAEITTPLGITVDGHGNVYIGDRNNFRVRKVDAAGVISTFAGNGVYGYSGDNGPATSAKLSYIWGLAADTAGNVYICDGQNHRVRKVDTGGVITTIAGTGTAGTGGDGGLATSAQLNLPTGVFLSKAGDLYISDFHNNRVRKINSAGVISTIAGTGTMGFSGDNGPALAAELSHPISAVMDDSNNIYIADMDNVRVRKINTIPALAFTAGNAQNLSICEDAAATSINALLSAKDYYNGLTDTWGVITAATNGVAVISYTTTTTGGILTPTGALYTPNTGYAGYDSFRVLVANGVLADTITIHVTIKPTLTSAGTIIGPTSVCVNASITLSDGQVGGIWHSDYMGSIATTSGGGVLTGILPGIDTIRYTLTGCGTATSIIIVTVNPLPDPGIIDGPVNICAGATITLTETVSGGAWSNTTNKTIISPITGGLLVKGVSGGIDVIKYNVSDSFCTAVAAHSIVVDTVVQIAAITGPPNICIGSAVVYTDMTLNGTWSLDNAIAAMVNDTITGLVTGTADLSYTITNACGTFFATKTLRVNPLPEVPVVNNYGGILTASPGYAAYQWYRDGSAIPGATTDTCRISAAGIYVVSVTDTAGCDASSADQNYSSCEADDISVFPNPNTSILYINWCKELNARLIGMDGKTLTTIEHAHEIDMSALPDGTYILLLYDTNGNKLKTKQVTKLNK